MVQIMKVMSEACIEHAEIVCPSYYSDFILLVFLTITFSE